MTCHDILFLFFTVVPFCMMFTAPISERSRKVSPGRKTKSRKVAKTKRPEKPKKQKRQKAYKPPPMSPEEMTTYTMYRIKRDYATQ